MGCGIRNTGWDTKYTTSTTPLNWPHELQVDMLGTGSIGGDEW
jgi:hypothetical protein